MVAKSLKFRFRKTVVTLTLSIITLVSSAQTNVFDDIIATSANHTSLTAALIQQGLDVTLQDPAANYTVFAPDDAAFSNLASNLGTDIAGLLTLPNLTDILLYHVLGVSVQSSGINNGDLVTPLNIVNTIKLTKTTGGDVYANQAQVNAADLSAANGYVHSIDAVLLSNETVVDVAIDNGYTTLTAAVIKAELLPALTNPFASLTVFAPDNAAFDDLATFLGTDLNGILALPELGDILLYHVVDGTILAGALANGFVPTLNGQSIQVDLTTGVMINASNVTIEDVTAENGVVHVIDAVLLPSPASLEESQIEILTVSPNPTSNLLRIHNSVEGQYEVISMNGELVQAGTIENGMIDVSTMVNGTYYVRLNKDSIVYLAKFIKK
ncbi:MAG: putative surface protein with fasciclin (FAS1) repeats [Crocinitomicaceae bacterium]|jgi:uncharacterized surface protein with fasciclin (FAS1) repeats